MFAENSTGNPEKKKRILLTLAQKVEILDALSNGGSFASVAKQFNLNDSTVRTIKQAEQSIRHSARYGSDTSNKIMFASRAPCIEMMERKLNEWYIAETEKGGKKSNREITEMAKKIFSEVKTPGDGTVFMGSNTWLYNFKKRFSIQNSTLSKKVRYLDAWEEIEQLKNSVKAFIEEGEYLPEQVFNIDENVLYWNRLPTEDLNSFTERLSLLFCCNASGDFMSMPLVVHRSPFPEHLISEPLPVFWRANSRYAITERELMDWYSECFIPSVKKYLASKFLNFKLLLIMDRKTKFDVFHMNPIENITIRYLPSSTKHTLKPLSKGIFPAFKRYYLRRMLSHLSQSMFLNPALKLFDCWKVFTMANCVEIMKEAIDEISASDINACWKEIWPEVVHEFSTLPNEQIEIDDILQVMREINDPSCCNVELKDIASILGTDVIVDGNKKDNYIIDKCTVSIDSLNESKILKSPSEFIIQNEAETIMVNLQDGVTKVSYPPLLMPKESLNQIFEYAQTFERLVLKLDPYVTRSQNFSEGLEKLLRPYKEEHAKYMNGPKQNIC